MNKPICVQSEVGKLKTVMLHCPGADIIQNQFRLLNVLARIAVVTL